MHLFQPSPPVSLSPSSAVPMADVSVRSGVVTQVRTTTLKTLYVKIGFVAVYVSGFHHCSFLRALGSLFFALVQTTTVETAATRQAASAPAPTPSSSAPVAGVSQTTGPVTATTTVETTATRTRPAEVDQHVRRLSLKWSAGHFIIISQRKENASLYCFVQQIQIFFFTNSRKAVHPYI